MSKCKKCQIYIKDDTEVCPLCKCVMEKSGDTENTYPDIYRKNRVFSLLMRIYLFVGIVIEANFTQLQNASSPIDVTLSGMMMSVRLSHQWNALFPIAVTPSGMLIDDRPWQNEKA